MKNKTQMIEQVESLARKHGVQFLLLDAQSLKLGRRYVWCHPHRNVYTGCPVIHVTKDYTEEAGR